MLIDRKAAALAVSLFFATGAVLADGYQDAMTAYNATDYNKAFQLMQEPAGKGDAEAEFWVGIMYSRGQGVTQDAVKAIEWWKKAVAKDHMGAQQALAESYAAGTGIKKDSAKAAKLATLTAEKNLANGQYLLGSLYEGGQGVKASAAEAYKWYYLAEAHSGGFAPAAEGMKRLEKTMKPEQVAAAKSKALKWVETKQKQEAAAAKKQKK